MPALVAGISFRWARCVPNRDGRDKPGHDRVERPENALALLAAPGFALRPGFALGFGLRLGADDSRALAHRLLAQQHPLHFAAIAPLPLGAALAALVAQAARLGDEGVEIVLAVVDGDLFVRLDLPPGDIPPAR